MAIMKAKCLCLNFSSDIKGGNIMLMPTGVIKLIDFGCAKRLYMVSNFYTFSENISLKIIITMS